MVRLWFAGLTVVTLFACKSGDNDDGDAGNGRDATGMDAPFSGMCSSGGAQCANCQDDDLDGTVDGFDPECTGPLDDDEATFRTGIPGDNTDAVNQDCFFDGNASSDDDGCAIHICCVLGAMTKQQCPLGSSRFNPAECGLPLPQHCINVCSAIAPAGCDCFGCCTICNPAGMCRDVEIHPMVSPNCDPTNVMDPGADTQVNTGDDPCRGCIKSETCGNSTCGGSTCIACPGQPSSCGTPACPAGQPLCDANGNCGVGRYCSNGCCIGTIP